MSSGWSTTPRRLDASAVERPARCTAIGHAVHAARVPERAARIAAARRRAPAGRRSLLPSMSGDATRRRMPAVPEGPLVRRIRVRLGLGRRLPAPRPALLPEAAGRGAVHAGARAAPARSRRPARRVLLRAMRVAGAEAKLSSAHLLFADDARSARPHGQRAGCCAARCSSTGPTARPHRTPDFADFLGSLQHDKRKKIQQERRTRGRGRHRVSRAARAARSAQADWDFFYRCYTLTYRAHHSTPYLTRDFFARMAARWPQHWLLFVASARRQAHRRFADRDRPSKRSAFGRYWGAHRTRRLPALRGLLLPAAGVVHRAALPPLRRRRARRTQDGARPAAGDRCSAHWLAHPAVRAGGRATSCSAKARAVDEYIDELNERRPFKA